MRAAAAIVLALALGLATSCRGHAPASDDLASRLTEKRVNLLPQGMLGSDNYTPRHLAGYFSLNRTYGPAEMFYTFYERRTADDTAPLILWMTGGPGCSSELAAFVENGPFWINKDLTLRPNPFGWDRAGSLIYVDQPINTGFSYSEDDRDRVYDEKVVARDMIDFLLAFMQAHPEFHGRDFYVTGESYAGHYVPAVSSAVHRHARAHADSPLNLRGLAIGNGLTNPAIQYGAYAAYALQRGLISQTYHDVIKATFPLCKLAIDACNSLDLTLVCMLALTYCQSTQFASILTAAGNINVYDIRKECVGPLCYDFSRLDDYLAQPHVREELGVGDRDWQECNMDVNFDMQGDWMKNYEPLVGPLLDDGLSVLIYEGVEDLICNWVGNERWVDTLAWANATAFQTADEEIWTVNGTDAGSVRSGGRLSFVKVKGAGHMSPMDQPENLLDLISHFVTGQPVHTRAGAAASLAAAARQPGAQSLRAVAAAS